MSWFPPLGGLPRPALDPVVAAFDRLPPGPRAILDRLLHAGETCSHVAQTLGTTVHAVRTTTISTMKALRAVASPPVHVVDAATDGLLCLHALRALDADEATAVIGALHWSRALVRIYQDHRDFVASLYAMSSSSPPPFWLARLARPALRGGNT